jgi:transcriptional regulator with XRE-family HTH domain
MEHALLRYRKVERISLRDLASRAKTTAATLSRIENWEQTPSLDLVERIVAATGGFVRVEDFLKSSRLTGDAA